MLQRHASIYVNLIFLLFGCIPASSPLASSCIEPSDAREWYNSAPVIVVGQILDYHRVPATKQIGLVARKATATIRVIEPLKGPVILNERLTMDLMALAPYGPAQLLPGHNYVLFLKPSPDSASYQLPVCGRQYELEPSNYKKYDELLYTLKPKENRDVH